MSGIYPKDWPAIAAKVKHDAGWRCIRCNHQHDVRAGYMLTVHHLDLNKSNCEWWNLVALCQRCHLKIQGRVDMAQMFMFGHTGWLKKYIEGRERAKQRSGEQCRA